MSVMSTPPLPVESPTEFLGRDRFIYGSLRNRKMRNPDPETPAEAFQQRTVQFYFVKSWKFIHQKWVDTKKVFSRCTRGFEAKVINVVGYSILQVVLDLTVLQSMILQGDIAFTHENLQALAIFFFTTIIGAVITVYRSPIGTTLLILTQLAGVVIVYEHFSRPLVEKTIEMFLNQREKYPFSAHFFRGTLNIVSTFGLLFLCVFPTILGIWFIYCTVMLMIVLLGFQIYENQQKEEDPFGVITVLPTSESSTLMETPRSSPAETDYFSDNSSL